MQLPESTITNSQVCTFVYDIKVLMLHYYASPIRRRFRIDSRSIVWELIPF